MPVEKLDNIEKLENKLFRKGNAVTCYRCNESKGTMIRRKNLDGRKKKPAEYICAKCNQFIDLDELSKEVANRII